jgi:hypothetical protein
VIPTLIIFWCVAVWVAFFLSTFCAYNLGRYRGWNEVLGEHKQHQLPVEFSK